MPTQRIVMRRRCIGRRTIAALYIHAASGARWGDSLRFAPMAAARKMTATATAARPSAAQGRYLRHGISQPGGKLPLFDSGGQEISPATIQACIRHGWAEPWFANPLKQGWLVCKLTAKGRAAIDSASLLP